MIRSENHVVGHFKGSKFWLTAWFKGRNWYFHSFSILQKIYSEWRQFAMMAAQGLDVLWQCSCMSLVLFVVATSGSKTGMLAVFYAH